MQTRKARVSVDGPTLKRGRGLITDHAWMRVVLTPCSEANGKRGREEERKGREKGKKRGREEGKKRGREEGRTDRRRETGRKEGWMCVVEEEREDVIAVSNRRLSS
jgi:hypothetical protein